MPRDVPAVSRAIKILRFLARNGEPIGVVPLARQLKMIPSTCLHIIRVLLENGMVSFNPQTKRYTLGPGVLAFATAYSLLNPFVRLVRARLQDLSKVRDCAFAAIEGSGPEHYVVVAATDPAPGLSIRLAAGSRYPLLVSAAGLCFAAFGDLTRSQLKDGFAKLRWDNAPSYSNWLKHVERTRKSGYAVDVGEYLRGITVIAVPALNDGGRMLGCLCAVGLREQMSESGLHKLIENLRSAAQSVSVELGHGTGVDESPNPVLQPATPRRSKHVQRGR